MMAGIGGGSTGEGNLQTAGHLILLGRDSSVFTFRVECAGGWGWGDGGLQFAT